MREDDEINKRVIHKTRITNDKLKQENTNNIGIESATK